MESKLCRKREGNDLPSRVYLYDKMMEDLVLIREL